MGDAALVSDSAATFLSGERRLAAILTYAAVQAGCRQGGLRYSKASRAERTFGLCSAVLRYRAASQVERATIRSDGPLACRAERKLGRFADLRTTAARCRPASQVKRATTRSDGPLACRAERKLGLFAGIAATAARYRAVSQVERATNRRVERKLGLFADLLANAAVQALRRPGGPRYWMAFRSERKLDRFAITLPPAEHYPDVSKGEHTTARSEGKLGRLEQQSHE